jgi:hypothetical protein
MMTQEKFVDVQAMKCQGLTNLEIAKATGYHREPIGGWLKNGGPSTGANEDDAVVHRRALGGPDRGTSATGARLLATRVFEILRTKGFDGSYPPVAVNELRGPSLKAAGPGQSSLSCAGGCGSSSAILNLSVREGQPSPWPQGHIPTSGATYQD